MDQKELFIICAGLVPALALVGAYFLRSRNNSGSKRETNEESALEMLDPLKVAEVYLAEGRDVKAVEILFDALKSDPYNRALRDGLAGIKGGQAQLDKIKTFDQGSFPIVGTLSALTGNMAPPVSAHNESSPDDLRALGWSVASHYDAPHGAPFSTTWLFIKDQRSIFCQADSDATALNKVRTQLVEPSPENSAHTNMGSI